MPRFLIHTPALDQKEVFLDPDQTHHAASVFRIKKGDSLDLFDGKGGQYAAVAGDVIAGKLAARILQNTSHSSSVLVPITLAVGVFKPERMEILIQKATELGVHAIVPLLTERSVVKLSPERWKAKIARWQKIAQESCKQCGLPTVPRVDPPVLFKNFIPEIKNYEVSLIPTLEGATTPLISVLPKKKPKSIVALVGPEGDFSAREVGEAMGVGARPVSLGPLVLRSETAGMYLLSTIHFYYREVLHAL